jgi:peptidoglycan/LPS O-acetylase OafA/YrhL
MRILGFDGIRGLSVLAVILTHLHVYPVLEQVGLLSPKITPMINGTIGVQAFFILSGFLITYLLIRENATTGTVSLRNFFVRRALRIFPIYWLVLILLFIMTMWLNTGVDRRTFVYAFLYSYNFVPNVLYSNLIGHTWSLAVEEHFYLVWPVIFVFLFRRNPNHLTMLLIVAIAGSYLLFDVLQSNEALMNAYFVGRWTPFAGREIAFGCLGALLVTSAQLSFRRFLGSRIAIALGVAFYASSLVPVLPAPYMRPIGLALVIFWIFLNQESRLVRFLEIRPLAYLGMISYGVYMYQGFFLATGPYRFPGQEWPPHSQAGLLLLAIVAPLSFHFLERPILRLKSKFTTRKPDHLDEEPHAGDVSRLTQATLKALPEAH